MELDWNQHLEKAIKILSDRLNLQIKNKLLFYEALTHKSFLYFYPNYPYGFNERLEFLGDAILEFVVSLYLFKKYPKFNEGELTLIRASLINRDRLAELAEKFSLNDLVLRGRNINERGLKTVLSDAFEALVGAIFLDNDLDVVRKFIEENVLENLDEIVEKRLYKDPKSILQEILQGQFKALPKYQVLKEEGPPHQRKFTVGLFLEDKLLSVGEGESKQEAEMKAALKALKKLNVKLD